jgi:L-ascorbate metabolism protein UlaG (beta-lactamase superfamily)
MMRVIFTPMFFMAFCAFPVIAQEPFETDVIETSAGDLKITFLGHASLILTFGGKVIHVDPFSQVADYAKLPKADVIFITHDHGDHLDLKALEKIRTDKTVVVLTEKCAAKVKGGIIMKNGDVQRVAGIKVKAVPAYNIVHKRDNGQPYHPKGEGNGYVLTFGDAAKAFKPKVLYPYHYGDTDTSKLVALLKDDKEIEVRIRKMR